MRFPIFSRSRYAKVSADACCLGLKGRNWDERAVESQPVVSGAVGNAITHQHAAASSESRLKQRLDLLGLCRWS